MGAIFPRFPVEGTEVPTVGCLRSDASCTIQRREDARMATTGTITTAHNKTPRWVAPPINVREEDRYAPDAQLAVANDGTPTLYLRPGLVSPRAFVALVLALGASSVERG